MSGFATESTAGLTDAESAGRFGCTVVCASASRRSWHASATASSAIVAIRLVISVKLGLPKPLKSERVELGVRVGEIAHLADDTLCLLCHHRQTGRLGIEPAGAEAYQLQAH